MTELFLKNYRCTFPVNGHSVTAEVSPCSHMYSNYGLQMMFKLVPDGGEVALNRKDIPWAKVTIDDINRMMDSIKIVPCKNPGCDRPAFDASLGSNREGQCEQCFMKDWQDKWDKLMVEVLEENLKYALDAKSKGHRFFTVGWVHPEEGGDDYETFMGHTSRPAKKTIQNHLKRSGSCVLDDFKTYPIDQYIAKMELKLSEAEVTATPTLI